MTHQSVYQTVGASQARRIAARAAAAHNHKSWRLAARLLKRVYTAAQRNLEASK